MARDSKLMRGERPFLFTNLKTGDRRRGLVALDSPRACSTNSRIDRSVAAIDDRSASAVGRHARLELRFERRGARTVVATRTPSRRFASADPSRSATPRT